MQLSQILTNISSAQCNEPLKEVKLLIENSFQQIFTGFFISTKLKFELCNLPVI